MSEDEASRFVADIQAVAEAAPDTPASEHPVTADPKDEFLVAIAQAALVTARISGDPHLTDLVGLDRPVLTAAAFLARLDTTWRSIW